MIKIIYIELQQTVILYYIRIGTMSRPCLFYWWPFCRGFRVCENLHNRTPFKTAWNRIYIYYVHTKQASFRVTIFLPPQKVFVSTKAPRGVTSSVNWNVIYYIIFIFCRCILSFSVRHELVTKSSSSLHTHHI